jgi:Tfp pilus assembly protein PilF
VIARTSAFAFKGQNTDVRRIAETLGVAHILEGSVRKAGTRIRVTAQLIAAADGTHLWSQRYDRDLADVFAVQDEIASAIATALRVKLGAAPKVYVPKPEAHEALLKGRHQLLKYTRESLKACEKYLKKAAELDPDYAAPHAALAEYYWGLTPIYVMSKREAEPLARAAALRALELDPSSPQVHAVLCGMAAQFDFDWPEAERQFLMATAGDTVPPDVRQMCAFCYLLPVGRKHEAIRQLELAVRDDPLNVTYVMQLGVYLHAAGEFEQAFERYRQALEIDDKNWPSHWNQGSWFIERGQYENARQAFNAAHAILPSNASIMGAQAAAHTLLGDGGGAQDLLAQVESREPYAAAGGFFNYYTLVQDFEKAADWAAKAIELGNGEVSFLLQFAFCRGLRSSPYWPKLAKMLNLPVGQVP